MFWSVKNAVFYSSWKRRTLHLFPFIHRKGFLYTQGAQRMGIRGSSIASPIFLRSINLVNNLRPSSSFSRWRRAAATRPWVLWACCLLLCFSCARQENGGWKIKHKHQHYCFFFPHQYLLSFPFSSLSLINKHVACLYHPGKLWIWNWCARVSTSNCSTVSLTHAGTPSCTRMPLMTRSCVAFSFSLFSFIKTMDVAHSVCLWAGCTGAGERGGEIMKSAPRCFAAEL